MAVLCDKCDEVFPEGIPVFNLYEIYILKEEGRKLASLNVYGGNFYEQFLNRGSITKYRERDNYFVVIRRILWKRFFMGQIIYGRS